MTGYPASVPSLDELGSRPEGIHGDDNECSTRCVEISF